MSQAHGCRIESAFIPAPRDTNSKALHLPGLGESATTSREPQIATLLRRQVLAVLATGYAAPRQATSALGKSKAHGAEPATAAARASQRSRCRRSRKPLPRLLEQITFHAYRHFR